MILGDPLFTQDTQSNIYLFKPLILDFHILRRKYLTHFPISFLSRAGQSGARVGEAIGASQPYLLQNHLSEISDILVSPILPKFPSPEILKSVLLSLVWKFTCPGFSVIFLFKEKVEISIKLSGHLHSPKCVWERNPLSECGRLVLKTAHVVSYSTGSLSSGTYVAKSNNRQFIFLPLLLFLVGTKKEKHIFVNKRINSGKLPESLVCSKPSTILFSNQ